MSGKRRKIAIIGGGPAGSSAALFLSKHNVDITVFERQLNPGPVGAGILLQTTGLETLRHLNVLDKAETYGEKVHYFIGQNRGGSTVFDIDFTKFPMGYFGIGIQRATVFKLLFEQLPDKGIPVISGNAIVEISDTKDGQHLLLDNAGNEIGPFDMVIVASGSRTPLRRYLPKIRKEKKQSVSALWAKIPYEGTKYDNTLVQIYGGTEEMLGLMPVGVSGYKESTERIINFFWGFTNKHAENWNAQNFDSWKNHVKNFTPQGSGVIGKIENFEDVTLAPYYDVEIRPFYHNGVLFIGDSAHAMSPHLSSGTNLSLLDSRILEEVYSDKKPIQEIYSEFQKLRSPQIFYYTWISRIVTPLFQSNAPLSVIRNTLLKLAYKIPLSRSLILKTITGKRRNLFTDLNDKYYL